MSTLLALASTVLMLQAAPSVGLVSYDEAVRCAGLTQAASELEGGESAQGRQLYDAALYWSCLLYTSPSPRDATLSRMPSSA